MSPKPVLVPIEQQFYPTKEQSRVICGVSIVEWDFVVVYVRNKKERFDPPTQLYFSFGGSGDYYLDEVIRLVDQWTFRRGECLHPYKEGDHEYSRARRMACQAVATYRREYLAKYGQPPNPLLLTGTLDENLVRRITYQKET